MLISIATGCAVLDTLLKEKFRYAELNGIEVNCNVTIPEDFAVDDMDLCVVFSNILDNAIRACLESGHIKPSIVINTKARFRFLIIESSNPSSSAQPFKAGTGLKNIESVTKNTGEQFIMENRTGFLVSAYCFVSPVQVVPNRSRNRTRSLRLHTKLSFIVADSLSRAFGDAHDKSKEVHFMPIPIHPDYVNPLTVKENRSGSPPGHKIYGPANREDTVTKLQTKQQQLQNKLLLLKTTGSDTAGSSVEKLKQLKERLNEVSSDLRSAKNDRLISSNTKASSLTGQTKDLKEPAVLKEGISSNMRYKDYYEKEAGPTASPGIYQIKPGNGNHHYKTVFSPYTES